MARSTKPASKSAKTSNASTAKSRTKAASTTSKNSKKSPVAPKKSTPITPKKSTPSVTKIAAIPAPKKVITPTPVVTPKASHTPTRTVTKPPENTGTTMTTILILFVLALAILAGYIYSQSMLTTQLEETPITMNSAPLVEMIPTLSLTPDMELALGIVATNFAIEPGEILQNVRVISDVEAIQAESPDFYRETEQGDYIFEFRTRSFIYRPIEKKIINVGEPIPVTKRTSENI